MTGNSGTGSPGLSATIRAEFALIAAGFDKLPSTFVANRPVVVNSGGTALTLAGGGLILAGDLTTSGAFNTTLVQQANVTLTLPAVNGELVPLSNGRLITKASGGNGFFVQNNLGSEPGNLAFGYTTDGAGTITSVDLYAPLKYGGVTLTEAVTGTGKMVLDTAPTLSNPVVGTQAMGDNSTKGASTEYVDRAIPTGTMLSYVGSTAPEGFVLASGRTIGDALSGGTERANADTEALFTLLWNSMADAEAPVSGGRGGSAAADFAAHKTITLPDGRGRSIAGKDNMGGSAANRITNANSGITATTLGAAGGSETHAHSVSGNININAGGPFGDNINVTIGGGGGSVGQGHQHNVSGPFGGTSNTVSRVHPAIILNYIIRL